jgi:NADPH2:quinone reductase
MRAVLCKQHGPPESLVIEDVPPRKPGKGEVVVSVKACGVNFPDTLIIQGKYQTKPELPFSPGGEIAGIVKEVGEGVTEFRRVSQLDGARLDFNAITKCANSWPRSRFRSHRQ